MSDTPRTDQNEPRSTQSGVGYTVRGLKGCGYVSSDFARTLERENTQLRSKLESVVDVIKAEAEYPDPCPKLRGFIAEAVANKDADRVLQMVRQAVRQTKESLIAKLSLPNIPSEPRHP